jgi:hypothetical protein
MVVWYYNKTCETRILFNRWNVIGNMSIKNHII